MISRLVFCAVLAAIGATAFSQSSPLLTIKNANWTGTDDLGRSLPAYEETGDPRPNHYVGLFYWQWHGGLRAGSDFDMTRFLADHPKFMDFLAFPPGGPNHPTYYWAQPLLGYYRSDDPWVIRKHLPLFAETGVDFLFLDYTNGEVYNNELQTFLDVARDLKSKGTEVPRLTFFLNFQPEWKVESLYRDWYKPGKFDQMWFRWQGKPLMMSPMPTDAHKLKNPALLKEIQDYFTWRPTWAYEKAKKNPGTWRFVHGYNCPPAMGPDGKIEQVVVNKSTGGPIWNAFAEGGVSAVEGKEYNAANYDNGWCLPDMDKGIFFENSWKNAMNLNPPILLVTGWNEWTASVWQTPGVVMFGRKTQGNQGHIVDEFNMQFNRDIEPMKGGYRDNYFWQFAINMRKYKGMLPPEAVSSPITIAPNSPPGAWDNITPKYLDTVGDIANRDWDSNVRGIHYKDNSARNDFALSQVARDSANVVFHVQTAGPLSPSTDRNWMMLLIDSDNNAKTGWNGYDLLINRTRDGGACSVEQYVGADWTWKKVADVTIHIDAKDLAISLPRALLSTGSLSGRLKFNFKWIDNLPDEPDLMDCYTHGDAAPDARFSYHFEEPRAGEP